MSGLSTGVTKLSLKRVLLPLSAVCVIVWVLFRDTFPQCDGCERGGEWAAFQRQMVQEINADSRQQLDIVFLGDSITEALRGSSKGSKECIDFRCKGIPQAFAEAFGSKKTAVLGISGDQTAHLQWRLAHGEGPAVQRAAAVVVLIGTNDLSIMVNDYVGGWQNPKRLSLSPALRASIPAELEQRIHTTVTHIRRINPAAKVVLLGLLPRGASFKPASFEWPNGVYTDVMGKLNHRLAKHYEKDPAVSFVECSDAFVDTHSGLLIKGMMPDGLHPSDRGSRKLFECVKDALRAFELSKVGARTA